MQPRTSIVKFAPLSAYRSLRSMRRMETMNSDAVLSPSSFAVGNFDLAEIENERVSERVSAENENFYVGNNLW